MELCEHDSTTKQKPKTKQLNQLIQQYPKPAATSPLQITTKQGCPTVQGVVFWGFWGRGFSEEMRGSSMEESGEIGWIGGWDGARRVGGKGSSSKSSLTSSWALASSNFLNFEYHNSQLSPQSIPPSIIKAVKNFQQFLTDWLFKLCFKESADRIMSTMDSAIRTREIQNSNFGLWRREWSRPRERNAVSFR